MTRERVKELLPIITAFAEGKTIQGKYEEDNEWKDIKYPTFNDAYMSYRIKPEETYRPYKDCDEMIKDFKQRFNTVCPPYALPLIWIKDICAKSLITDFGVQGDDCMVCLGASNYDMEELFNDFTYLDGSRIGVKE